MGVFVGWFFVLFLRLSEGCGVNLNTTPKHSITEKGVSQNGVKPRKTAKTDSVIPQEGIERVP
ncbi:MAG: hypothetical protein QXJ73_08440, partial [Candidatus Caldarchaeum sp.]